MRMDVRCEFFVYDVVNIYIEDELIKIIKDYGEDNWVKCIVKFIVEERVNKLIEIIGELVDVIKKVIFKKVRIDGFYLVKRIF